jgi:methylmalonyl-CoA/ethylmalonyl-CoA epimerase
MIKNINHIAVIVPELDTALSFWVDALGLTLDRTEDVPAEGVNVAFLPVGGSNVELLKPTTTDSGVARFLEKRGPGIHHLCLEVDDIDATMERLREHDIQLINEEPQTGHGGRKYAFVHPKSTGGVLVELYQLAGGEHEPPMTPGH